MKDKIIKYGKQGLLFVWKFIKPRKRLSKDLKKYQKASIDFDGLIKSTHASKGLYKELSRKYHPDKFIGTDKHKQAEELFKEIESNRNNANKLEQLKQKGL